MQTLAEHPEFDEEVRFLRGGGEMARLIAAFDWSTTALGPIGGWPQSLKTACSLLLLSPVPIVMLWGADGYMLYNGPYSVFAGGRHPQLLGGRVREGWPEVADFNDNVLKVGLSGGTLAYRDQELTLHRSGTPEQVSMNLAYSPVLGEDGAPVGVIAIVIETTERRTAEAALRESETQLRLATEYSEVGLWDLDPVADTLFWPPRVKAMFGISPDAPISMADFYAGLHPEDSERVAAAFKSATDPAVRAFYDVEYRTVGKEDGIVRWVAAKGRGVFDEAGVCRRVIGTALDVTSRRAIEARVRELNENLEAEVERRTRDLQETQEALRQSQKMEAVGQLTGGLAHDFNNLLTAISGSLEIVQSRIAQGRFTSLDRYLNAAQTASKRAAALTHRLLAFSRRQTLDPKPTDVNRLVRDMEELVRRTVGPLVQIEIVGAAGLWPTLVDPNQLENALLNLCINARDAMPDGGRITVETANIWLDARGAAERDLSPSQYVSLCVTDTGTGMTPEVQARAFDPFFTTKPLGEGTGLGLSMIYGFARQSGGQVRIYSELGHGTTLCLYLPRHHAAGAHEAPALNEPEPAERGSGEVVLVIDDEPTIRMLIAEILEEFGYSGIEAADGPSGLKVLQSAARVDLLITDVGLPGGMNGRQVADAARVLRPGLKVLFITGYAENAAVGNGHLTPGMEVLTKPFAMDALAQRIRRLVES